MTDYSKITALYSRLSVGDEDDATTVSLTVKLLPVVVAYALYFSF